MSKHAKRRRSRWPWSRTPSRERTAERVSSSYDHALRRHRRHVLAVRVGAVAIFALLLAGTVRALTFSAPTPAPPDGAQMTTVAAVATGTVEGSRMLAVDAESSDTWQVTLIDTTGRCWLVRVAETDGVIGALPPPAIIACPPEIEVDADPGPEVEPGTDVDLVARGFVEAYLTASPSIQRYLAPGVEMVLPAPVEDVSITEVRAREVTDARIATVSALADGFDVGYRLRLVDVEGRWWVEDLFAGPFIGTLTTTPPPEPPTTSTTEAGLAADSTDTTSTSDPAGSPQPADPTATPTPEGAGTSTTSTAAAGGTTTTATTTTTPTDPRPTLPVTSTTVAPGPGE